MFSKKTQVSYNIHKMKLHWDDIDWYRELSLPGYKFEIKNNKTIGEIHNEGNQ